MADAGIGEAALASAALEGSAGAGAGALGTDAILSGAAGTGGFIPAAGMDAGLFSTLPGIGEATTASGLGAGLSGLRTASGLMGPTYAELGYLPAMGPSYAEMGYTGLGAGQMGPTYEELGYTGMNPAGVPAPSSPDITDPSFFKKPLQWIKDNPKTAIAAGVGLPMLANILRGGSLTKPNYLPTYQPVTAQQMGLGRAMSPNYTPQTNAMYNRGYAEGGITSIKPANVDFMGGDMYPQSQIERSYYATPSQMPTSAQQVAASYEPKTNPLTGEQSAHMAEGGITSLGHYSDGGRMLKGPGDGMSDNIPATIGGKQPARLADGEFVVPADVVSHLGNGSTDAGAKRLYGMMDKVRQARTGTKKQGKQIKAEKYLPK